MHAIIKWLHHLFDPHCIQCVEERTCSNCVTLRQLLEFERHEKKQLLDRILYVPPKEEPKSVPIEQIKPNPLTWSMRKQLLEQEDRAKAEILRRNEQLEKKLEIESAS